ncbi:MAG: diaminopimelate epimerase [Gammaproteobacteria bacterium]
MAITFHKMHGLGNDFVLLDCRDSPFSLTPQQTQLLADRRTGIGFDQLLILEQSAGEGIDARYRIFNQDGSSAEHCGNGIRCVAKYLHDRLPGAPTTITVEIERQLFELTVLENGEIRVDMGVPVFEPQRVPSTFDSRAEKYSLVVCGQEYNIGVVSMGNPHAVFLVEDLATFPVAKIGREMQHNAFFPNQVNAGFMQIIDAKNIKLRVWERGAGETLACGTGACAAAVIGRLWGELDEKVRIQLRGGDLIVEWSGNERDSVWMTGAASYVFEGRIEL